MKRLILVSIMAVLLWSCSKEILIKDAVVGSRVYSMFGGTPERNFYVPFEASDSLKLLWEEEVNGSFASTSVTAFSDFIFVPDLSGRVYSFNIKTGKSAGQLKHKGAVNPAPIIQQNKIIFPVAEIKENKTTIRIYDFNNGKEVQKYDIKGMILSEIIRTDDGFLFVTENGKAMRYNYGTGKVWEYASGVFVHSSPAFSGGSMIFGNDKGEVIILDSSGKVKSRQAVGSGFEGGFTISGNSYFAGDNSGVLFCGNLQTGKVTWSIKTGERINTTPVLDDNSVYISNLKGAFYKVEKETGKTEWQIETGGVLNVTPLAFKNYILLPDMNRKLYFIDNRTGRIANTMNFKSRTKLVPVYYQNTLFLGADDGKIFAYEFVN